MNVVVSDKNSKNKGVHNPNIIAHVLLQSFTRFANSFYLVGQKKRFDFIFMLYLIYKTS